MSEAKILFGKTAAGAHMPLAVDSDGKLLMSGAASSHRPFNLYDEPSWWGTVPLPIITRNADWTRFASNPIIPVGAGGSYDATGAYYGGLCLSKDKTKVYLPYTASPAALTTRKIAIAEDTRANWEVFAFAPVKKGLIYTGTAAWELSGGNSFVWSPCMVFDPIANKYKMYYSASITAPNFYMGYTYCSGDSDPTVAGNWAVGRQVTGLTGLWFVPAVVILGRQEVLFYADTNWDIRVATKSADDTGVAFTYRAVLLAGTYKNVSVYAHPMGIAILLTQDLANWSISLALSNLPMLEGATPSATLFMSNPILTGISSGWEGASVEAAAMVNINRTFYMVYTSTVAAPQIGVAHFTT